MRYCVLTVALALVLACSLFALAKAAPVETFAAYSDHVKTDPQSAVGCGCPGCSCIGCSCG